MSQKLSCKNCGIFFDWVYEIPSENPKEELCDKCYFASINSPILNFVKGLINSGVVQSLKQPVMPNIPNIPPCPKCNITIVDIGKIGRLGCPNDYDHFKEVMLKTTQHYHGAIKHTGHIPVSFYKTKSISDLNILLNEAVLKEDFVNAEKINKFIREKSAEDYLSELESSLKLAIKEEDYEKATKLRDLIKSKSK